MVVPMSYELRVLAVKVEDVERAVRRFSPCIVIPKGLSVKASLHSCCAARLMMAADTVLQIARPASASSNG